MARILHRQIAINSPSTTHLANALSKEQDGKLDEALACYDQAIEEGVEDVLLYSNRGRLLERLKRYRDALESFQQATALESNFRDHYNAGNMLLMLERHAEAIDCYAASITLRDDYPECWVNKGIAHHALDQLSDALDTLEKAIELDSSFFPALRSKAILLSASGKEAEAISFYQRAAQAQPNLSSAWFEYGCALYKNLGDQVFFDPSGPEGQAMQAFDKVIELAPDTQGAWGRKIGILFRLGDAAQATDAGAQSETVPRMFPIIHAELLSTIEDACARFPNDDWFAQRRTDAQNLK